MPTRRSDTRWRRSTAGLRRRPRTRERSLEALPHLRQALILAQGLAAQRHEEELLHPCLGVGLELLNGPIDVVQECPMLDLLQPHAVLPADVQLGFAATPGAVVID